MEQADSPCNVAGAAGVGVNHCNRNAASFSHYVCEEKEKEEEANRGNKKHVWEGESNKHEQEQGQEKAAHEVVAGQGQCGNWHGACHRYSCMHGPEQCGLCGRGRQLIELPPCFYALVAVKQSCHPPSQPARTQLYYLYNGDAQYCPMNL